MQTLIQLSQIDTSLVMYIFGVVFGVISILYFTKDILVSLSVTVKSAILYSSSILIFSGGLFIQSEIISVILVIFCGFTYTSATIYIWKTYQLEKVGRFLVLAVSSVLLLSVGRSLQTGIFGDMEGMTAVLIGGLVPLLITILLSVVDTLEDDTVIYRFEFREDTIELEDSDKKLGSLQIENESYFRRMYSLPRLKAEVSNKKNMNLPVTYQNDTASTDVSTIKSGQKLNSDVVLFPNKLPNRSEVEIPESFEIEVVGKDAMNFESDGDEDIELDIIRSEEN